MENLLEISLQAADTLSSQKGRMARRMIDEDFADQPSVNYFCIDSQIVASLPRKKKKNPNNANCGRAWNMSL